MVSTPTAAWKLATAVAAATALLLLLHSWAVAGEEIGGGVVEGSDAFMLGKAEEVLKTEAGVMRVAKGYKWKGLPSEMHIGFIDMEPNTLFLPQYTDVNLVLFVRNGDARVGMIYEGDLVEKELRAGDIYHISAGTAFYLVNTGKGQRLRLICSIDTSESLGIFPFVSFFVAGGLNPPSVLAGFDTETLSTAFNVTSDKLRPVMERQKKGPIVYMRDEAPYQPRKMALEMQKISHDDDEVAEGGSQTRESARRTWGWSFLNALIGVNTEEPKSNKKGNAVDVPDPYNLYDKDPDFQNHYGWTTTVDGDDYTPLKQSGIGIYLINLTAGSMLAPHLNPLATEYGLVLGGSGTLQIALPNGSAAMTARIDEGDAFWVPRYLPFCQVASRNGPLELFGFATSARKSQPQFLVGASSVLSSMSGPELAAAFGVSEEGMDRVVSAQGESFILPSKEAQWEERRREREEEEEGGRGGTPSGGGTGRGSRSVALIMFFFLVGLQLA